MRVAKGKSGLQTSDTASDIQWAKPQCTGKEVGSTQRRSGLKSRYAVVILGRGTSGSRAVIKL